MILKNNTYRNLLTLAMVLVYLCGSFKGYQPYLSYKLNYSYISTVLCENKSKPEMNCKGKCYLSKELRKIAKEETQQKNKQAKENNAFDVIIESYHSYAFVLFSTSKENNPHLKEIAHCCIPEINSPPPQG